VKLLTFHSDDGLALGVATDRGVVDLRAAARAVGFGDSIATPSGFFARCLEALPDVARLVEASEAAGLPRLEESTLVFGPCVPAPRKIICIGLNYLRHAREAGQEPPAHPILFAKYDNALSGSHGSVTIPAVTLQVDYEAELVVVIGRRTRRVAREHALDAVLGYCNGNDLSARDLQFRTSQWLTGKSLDGFLPLGPYVVTADEAGDPFDMPVRLWLNGDLRQNSTTADLIFDVATLISEISAVMTLEPGDLISTGTPDGVILGLRDKTWLRAGDRIEIEIGSLGRLTTVMAGEAA
jgi:2-keto-4-pentenoate hydratase/2-oxohepta-3-ene-1,7-dioic acid hydratase in catechol pathway